MGLFHPITMRRESEFGQW